MPLKQSLRVSGFSVVCCLFYRFPQKRPETVLAGAYKDVMFNLIRTECFMERVLGIYVVCIIVSAGFLFIQEVRTEAQKLH